MAHRRLDDKQRTGVEGHVLRALPQATQPPALGGKGPVCPKACTAPKAANTGSGAPVCGIRVEEAQAEAQVVGKFKYLQKKTVGEKNAENLPTDADIAAIREIVEKALNDTVFVEDACNDVIFGSQALVGIYERNGEDALWHALAKAFAEADFTPADAELVINRIGTVGKSIEAVAAKDKDSPGKDHAMQRARILILLHRAYYKSHRQPVPELKNDGKQTATYCQLVGEYEDTVREIAEAKAEEIAAARTAEESLR